jgi:hypothetical protein
MPSAFNVTATTNDVQLPVNRQGSVALTISNISGKPQQGRVSIAALDSTRATWLNVDGGPDRNFPVGGAQQVTIQIVVPNDVKPGHYTFRPDVVAVQNPDEDSTQGPILAFEVPPPPPPPQHEPWWKEHWPILAAAAAAVVIIVGVVLFLFVFTTVVPDVTNQTLQNANSAITSARLVPQIIAQPLCPVFSVLIVSNQSPPGGNRVSPGSTVTLTLACRRLTLDREDVFTVSPLLDRVARGLAGAAKP